MKNPRLFPCAVAALLLAGFASTQAQQPPGGPGDGPGGPGGRGGRGGGRGGGMLATQMISQGDKNAEQKLTKAEMSALADAWFDKLHADKAGKLSRQQFAAKFGELLPAQNPPGDGAPAAGPPGGRGGRGGPGGFISGGLFTATDADKDGSLTRAEFKGAFEKWAADFTGMIYEERGRGFLAPRGQFSRVAAGGQTKQISTVGDSDALKAVIKQGDWNQLHIIARGGTLMQSINGHVMSALIDEDDATRAAEGVLGLQIHTGPPMKLQFRNVMYKKL